jgi:two-component system, OmpR family, KDP operon response regulator KdpE
MKGSCVFIVDGDPGVRILLRRLLTPAGYSVRDSEPSQKVFGDIADQEFDLLILDIDLRTNDGQDVLCAARALTSAPILALSTRPEEEAAAYVLDQGADDYVRKPFDTRVLLARVRNALRRRAVERGKLTRIVTNELNIDLTHRRICVRGNEVHLPVKSYDVLRVLTESAGRVLTHKEIFHAVWGSNQVFRPIYLWVAIQKLRRAIEPDPAHPRCILTERGVGYRLAVPNHRTPESPKSIPR